MPLHPNSSSAESDLVPEPADELGSFSWTKQWYPVARVEDLDESKPTPVSLFEDGMLQCTYHGWKFDTDSACTSVPQAESPQQDYQAAAHLKATVYLSQVQHRLLWVWPEADPNAHLEAMSTEATVRSDPLHENHTAYAILWFMRELPYGHDVLLENLLNPAHVPFAHHCMSGRGDRYQVPRSSLGQPHILQRQSWL
ncbi:TPA: hypothetical protein ACH3X2_007828 [Trebouxia sp. C0005]